MKNLLVVIFSIFLLLVSSSAIADEKDSTITMVKKNRNSFEASVVLVGGNFYPRVLIEDQDNFSSTTKLGAWALIEGARLPYTPSSWREKGYNPSDIYNLDLKVGITYSHLNYKLIFGAGTSSNKKYFGPLVGLSFEKGNLYFQVLGLYSATTAYKSEYSQEYIEKYKDFGKPIYVRGFDPNSWYRIKILYSASEKFDVGLTSERFYGTVLTAELNIGGNKKIKLGFGRDLEFQKNVFQFGFMLNMP